MSPVLSFADLNESKVTSNSILEKKSHLTSFSQTEDICKIFIKRKIALHFPILHQCTFSRTHYRILVSQNIYVYLFLNLQMLFGLSSLSFFFTFISQCLTYLVCWLLQKAKRQMKNKKVRCDIYFNCQVAMYQQKTNKQKNLDLSNSFKIFRLIILF